MLYSGPTLYPRLIELCEYAVNETTLLVTMTTHGHRLTDSFLKKLSGKVHFIRVSMDGILTDKEVGAITTLRDLPEVNHTVPFFV